MILDQLKRLWNKNETELEFWNLKLFQNENYYSWDHIEKDENLINIFKDHINHEFDIICNPNIDTNNIKNLICDISIYFLYELYLSDNTIDTKLYSKLITFFVYNMVYTGDWAKSGLKW